MHGVVPSATRVGIEFPSVSFLSCGPVRHSEALEEGSGSSVEVNVSYSLKEVVWVEVLSVYVELNVGLLVEFVTIEVLNPNAYIILN
jgi:hypothetical protein